MPASLGDGARKGNSARAGPTPSLEHSGFSVAVISLGGGPEGLGPDPRDCGPQFP